MAVTLKFNRDQVVGQLEAVLWERILRCIQLFYQTILATVNIHNPPPYEESSIGGDPPKKRTGFLQSCITREFNRPELAARVSVLANCLYALWLELGTKGGKVIRPKTAKCLVFFVKGKKIFAKKVTTKPLAARPFFKPTIDKIVPLWTAIMIPEAA